MGGPEIGGGNRCSVLGVGGPSRGRLQAQSESRGIPRTGREVSYPSHPSYGFFGSGPRTRRVTAKVAAGGASLLPGGK